MTIRPNRDRWMKWGLIFACWTIAGLVYSSHLYFFHNIFGEPISIGHAAAEAFADWYVWAALSPLIIYLARRFPFNRQSWRRSVLIHLPASLLLSLVQVIIHTLIEQIFIHGNSKIGRAH